MLDINVLVDELNFKCSINNVDVVQIATMDTAENRTRVLTQYINQALDFAYNRRKGTDKGYSREAFYNEVETKWKSTIINMAYTSIEKIGNEGHTSLNVGGVNRVFESGNNYLLSDVLQFVPLGGC